MTDDDDVGLPQTGLNKIIKNVLPKIRVSNQSRELLNRLCVEFVKLIGREAQQISSADQRKTISHDDVKKALKNLSFPEDYIKAADSVLDICKIKQEQRLKRKNSRLDKCGIPEDELYVMQQTLIKKARKEETEKLQRELLQIDNYSLKAENSEIITQNISKSLSKFMEEQNNDLLLTNDMKSILGANFIASIPPNTDENDDFDS